MLPTPVTSALDCRDPAACICFVDLASNSPAVRHAAGDPPWKVRREHRDGLRLLKHAAWGVVFAPMPSRHAEGVAERTGSQKNVLEGPSHPR